MSDKIEVLQKAAPVSNSTQIGVQYVGMSPEQAAKQTIDLFMDNFPKLQAIAKEIAFQRATELFNEVLSKLKIAHVNDFSPFSQPDIQYVMFEAQKNYARFGEKDKLDILSDLIVKRIQSDDKDHFKRIVDNAIIIVCELTSMQLDCLSVLFLLTKCCFREIITIKDLKEFLNNISDVFNIEKMNYRREVSYLNFKGCLQVAIPIIPKILSENYNFSQIEVEINLSDGIKQFTSDYGLSEIGVLLGLINARNKACYDLDPHIWIPD